MCARSCHGSTFEISSTFTLQPSRSLRLASTLQLDVVKGSVFRGSTMCIESLPLGIFLLVAEHLDVRSLVRFTTYCGSVCT